MRGDSDELEVMPVFVFVLFLWDALLPPASALLLLSDTGTSSLGAL